MRKKPSGAQARKEAPTRAALPKRKGPGGVKWLSYVFCLPDGRPLTAGMAKHPLWRALRRAEVSRAEGCLGWHDLRHTYGGHLAMRGVALKVIQELMGHATIEMTML